jgi:Uma2 family endonuclease
MPPSDSFTGMQSSKIVTHLTTWATRDGRGVVTDASVGFRLPDGALLAPDAAWTSKTRVLERNAVEAQGFWRLCADFIIELRSTPTASVSRGRKCRNGLITAPDALGLSIPNAKLWKSDRPGQDPETLIGIESIAGEGL